jgi:hypothetical protein
MIIIHTYTLQRLEQEENEMTDKLKQAAEETVKKLEHISRKLEGHRVWGGMKWEYHAILPAQYLPLRDFIDSQIRALRQALAEPTTMTATELADRIKQGEKWTVAEPDMGTDRGAWSDVEDATKWLDDLRGDEEDEGEFYDSDFWGAPNSTTDLEEPIGEIVDEFGLIRVSIPMWPPVGTKLYAAPPKREWVGLTDGEITEAGNFTVEGNYMLPHSFARAIEAKLKEKNT